MLWLKKYLTFIFDNHHLKFDVVLTAHIADLKEI